MMEDRKYLYPYKEVQKIKHSAGRSHHVKALKTTYFAQHHHHITTTSI
jgi:hypothetical protein